ncbi:hypothetical protein EG329_006371 [Mollisiaceae sp. DMI_Dod_QoI]|nr:hypothetical protein EG329_006371 [Helotiales sp. DMI_Dod_QoI]
MIFGRHRTNTDIHPTNSVLRYPPPWEDVCSTLPTSHLHFVNIPSEIRRLIFYQYFLSLNLPSRFFHHLTMLGFWASPPGPNSSPSDSRGFDLGRKIKHEVECLLQVNKKIHAEAEEVLYSSFIFYVHPRYQTQIARRALYARVGDSWKNPRGPRLPQKVQNIQINVAFGQPAPDWSSPEGWRGSWLFLVAQFPLLRKVGLAIEYNPRIGDDELRRQLMEMVVCFVGTFRPTCQVHVRFAGVKYDSYASLSPASPPLHADFLEEEKLLLHLRDEKKLIWHKVAKHFNEPRSELYSVAGLQARYQRLKLRQLQAEMEVEFLQRLKEELRDSET